MSTEDHANRSLAVDSYAFVGQVSLVVSANPRQVRSTNNARHADHVRDVSLQLQSPTTLARRIRVATEPLARRARVAIFNAFVGRVSRALVVTLPSVGFLGLGGDSCLMLLHYVVTPASNVCTANPCVNGGLCQAIPGGGFVCVCRPGFVGTLCESFTSTLRTDEKHRQHFSRFP